MIATYMWSRQCHSLPLKLLRPFFFRYISNLWFIHMYQLESKNLLVLIHMEMSVENNNASFHHLIDVKCVSWSVN